MPTLATVASGGGRCCPCAVPGQLRVSRGTSWAKAHSSRRKVPRDAISWLGWGAAAGQDSRCRGLLTRWGRSPSRLDLQKDLWLLKASVGGGLKGPLRDRDGPDSPLWLEDGANRLCRRQVEPTLGPTLLVGEGFATLLSAQFSSDRPTALGRPVAIRPGLASSRPPPSCYGTDPEIP